MYRHFLLSLLLVTAVGASPKHSKCRCRPTDPCWPAAAKWQALNASLDGNLVAARPVGLPCHDPTFDDAACEFVANKTTNSTWRGAEPGAVQNTNWEAWPLLNESCYVGSSRALVCGQGRVPLFSAEVETARHIQTAVKFARKHNLRLAIKNTGHCYLGRSSAPYSLRIATHKMKSLNFVDNFLPKGCGTDKRGGIEPKAQGPAVTIGAGVYLMDLYRAAALRNVTVVAGLAHTVGPAGGYIQGGGHSPLGNWRGMASDNALEFEVVTAEGELVVANDYQNQQLFWALRGGGGGTFGVVVSVTVRTFPEIPVYLASLQVNTTDIAAFWQTIREFHTHLPKISDLGGTGYYYQTPGTEASTLVMALIFANQSDEAVVRGLLTPMVTNIIGYVGNASALFQLVPIPESKYLFQTFLPSDADETGSTTILGSRLVSHAFLAAEDGPGRLVQAFQAVDAAHPGDTVIGHIVAGGQAASSKVDSALNPAWRKTVTHLVVGTGWGPDASLAEQQAIRDRITFTQVPLLKALEPDMGAYLNEADANEQGWQTSFWGSNYKKLYKLKKRWDPSGLFITRRGVGSEDWDEDGLCRVH